MRLSNILYELKLIYRLFRGAKHYEKYVWEDLKYYHKEAKYNSGIFENDKKIESIFSIAENKGAIFYYFLLDGDLHCRVKLLENYDPELATDIFVLTSHLNNLLRDGMVTIETGGSYVSFNMKTSYLINLFYLGDKHHLTIRHHSVARDLYWAFQQLVEKHEEPALIVADLLERNKEHNTK